MISCALTISISGSQHKKIPNVGIFADTGDGELNPRASL